MKISMIAAIGKNRELGAGNTLLWDIPEDMQFFREKTKGKPVIMGSKTFESIGHALPGRLNIVLSREPKQYEGATVVSTLRDAYACAEHSGAEEVFNIGGATVYALGIKDVHMLYLTHIDATFPEADAFFPSYEHLFKRITGRTSGNEKYCYEFVEYERAQ